MVVRYIGETRFKKSVETSTGLKEQAVLVPPPDKKVQFYDANEQRYKVFVIKFVKEGKEWLAKDIPRFAGEKLLGSPNYEEVKPSLKKVVRVK
jgi:hypothetical protein